MKHLFRGLFAALCAAVLSLTALADALPIPANVDPMVGLVLIAVIAVVLVILIRIVRMHKK